MPVPSRANALAGGRAETWCIRDRAGDLGNLRFLVGHDCTARCGWACRRQPFAHRKSAVLSGMSGVASPSGNFRPRFGHAPERSGKETIEEGTALSADAVKPLENLDLHRKSNPNFVPAGGQI